MNKKTRYTILSVIAIVLVTVAVTYAYWLVTRTQTEENIVTTGCLDISLTDEKNDILLENQFPLSDEEGVTLVPYEFTVTNNCDTPVDYYVALETYDTAETMKASSIKAQIDSETPALLSSKQVLNTTIEGATNSYLLKTGTLQAASDTNTNDSASHTLRIWIDANAPISEMSREFESKISVQVGQDIITSKLCQAATAETVTTGNIPTGEYNNGDEYICEVEDDVFYHFFVISRNDDSVNLIMDRNIAAGGTPATSENLSQTAWCSKEDYDAINTAETLNGTADIIDPNALNCTDGVCVEEGPITALRALYTSVSSWDNVSDNSYSMVVNRYATSSTLGELYIPDPNAQSNALQTAIWTPYTFNADYIKNITQDVNKTTLKARLMTVDEALANGCKYEINTTLSDGTIEKTNVYPNSCPLYLANNLQHKEGFVTGDKVVDINGIRGYWMLTGGGASNGYLIHDNGSINTKKTTQVGHSGIRPVITVALTDFAN